MDWIDFDRWPECRDMERPGIVFEVENAAGQSLLTVCSVPLDVPPDWSGAPIRFRPVDEPKPQHSSPLPPPVAK
jgi:hypothetical protein